MYLRCIGCHSAIEMVMMMMMMYITLEWQMVLCHGLEKPRIMLFVWFCFRLEK